jgi:hypothetical protein
VQVIAYGDTIAISNFILHGPVNAVYSNLAPAMLLSTKNFVSEEKSISVNTTTSTLLFSL